MECKYRERLSAFHDGELPEAAARELERHVAECAACAAELAEMRELSRSFADLGREDMTPSGLARAHQAADAAADDLASPVLRVAALLTAVAASVLLIGSAWLSEVPTGGPRPPQLLAVMPAPAPEWERVAMTLDASPLTGEVPGTSAGLVLATAPPADARLADWMLQNLSR
jgi:anti-sigma factor RsiW